jgi:hypothetical protein
MTNHILNFNNLPDEFYHNAYFPQVESINFEDETGLENKFGGCKPFFIEGEKWPTYESEPMIFFCQFRDPREDDNILYRVFFPDEGEPENGNITKIEMNEDNLKKQIVITAPEDNYYAYKPHIITHWDAKRELKHHNFISNHFKFSRYQEEIFSSIESYYHYQDEQDKFSPSPLVKIGGTPYFGLANHFVTDKNENNFFQLSDCEWMPREWGEWGRVHIYEDCTFDFDYY